MKTEIVFILDKSGSMNGAIKDYIGGFNAFLYEQQQQPGECYVTLVQFSDHCEPSFGGMPLALVPPLNRESYQPRGQTALFDALCTTIDLVGARLNLTAEALRPEQVIVVILTDGEENASQHFTAADAHRRITHQREVYGWEFIFLAANQDAFAVSAQLGVKRESTQSYVPDERGIGQTFSSTADAVRTLRSKQK